MSSSDPTSAWRPRHAMTKAILDTLADGREHQQAAIAHALGRTAEDGTTRRLLADLAEAGNVERGPGGWRLARRPSVAQALRDLAAQLEAEEPARTPAWSPTARWLARWLAPTCGAVSDPRSSALENVATLTRWADAIDDELLPFYERTARSHGADDQAVTAAFGGR